MRYFPYSARNLIKIFKCFSFGHAGFIIIVNDAADLILPCTFKKYPKDQYQRPDSKGAHCFIFHSPSEKEELL